MTTIQDIMNAYVETAEQYLSETPYEAKEIAENIRENYNGDAYEYFYDSIGEQEYFDNRIAYAFDAVRRSISELEYYDIVASASKLGNQEIDLIIENLPDVNYKSRTGNMFEDLVNYTDARSEQFSEAITDIMTILEDDYKYELEDFYKEFLQELSNEY